MTFRNEEKSMRIKLQFKTSNCKSLGATYFDNYVDAQYSLEKII